MTTSERRYAGCVLIVIVLSLVAATSSRASVELVQVPGVQAVREMRGSVLCGTELCADPEEVRVWVYAGWEDTTQPGRTPVRKTHLDHLSGFSVRGLAPGQYSVFIDGGHNWTMLEARVSLGGDAPKDSQIVLNMEWRGPR